MASDYIAEFAQTCLTIDRRPHLVVTSDLRVTFQCERTAKLLNGPMPLQVRNGRLTVHDEHRPGAFRDFLHTLDSEPRRFLLRAKSNDHWAMVFGWKPRAWEDQIFLLCNLSMPHCDVEDSGIAEDLNLTTAETKVLEQFARLRTPRDIAEELGVSLSTVRSHLKQIYSKAAVQSGIQLHQLVHTYCAA